MEVPEVFNTVSMSQAVSHISQYNDPVAWYEGMELDYYQFSYSKDGELQMFQSKAVVKDHLQNGLLLISVGHKEKRIFPSGIETGNVMAVCHQSNPKHPMDFKADFGIV